MTTPLTIATDGYLSASGFIATSTVPDVVVTLVDDELFTVTLTEDLTGVSMDITQLDLIRYRGDTKPWTFEVRDAAGVIMDITGHTFKFSGDTLQNPPTPSTTNLYTTNGVVPVGTDGRVSFAFTASAANNQLGTVYVDLQMIYPSGIIQTIAKGKIKYKQDITK